jgi:hypothetical protein
MSIRDDADEFAALLEKVRALPPMTEEQRIEQAFSFAWGNVAIEWPDPPPIPFEKFRADGWREEWRKAQKRIAELDKALADAIFDNAATRAERR